MRSPKKQDFWRIGPNRILPFCWAIPRPSPFLAFKLAQRPLEVQAWAEKVLVFPSKHGGFKKHQETKANKYDAETFHSMAGIGVRGPAELQPRKKSSVESANDLWWNVSFQCCGPLDDGILFEHDLTCCRPSLKELGDQELGLIHLLSDMLSIIQNTLYTLTLYILVFQSYRRMHQCLVLVLFCSPYRFLQGDGLCEQHLDEIYPGTLTIRKKLKNSKGLTWKP